MGGIAVGAATRDLVPHRHPRWTDTVLPTLEHVAHAARAARRDRRTDLGLGLATAIRAVGIFGAGRCLACDLHVLKALHADIMGSAAAPYFLAIDQLVRVGQG